MKLICDDDRKTDDCSCSGFSNGNEYARNKNLTVVVNSLKRECSECRNSSNSGNFNTRTFDTANSIVLAS